MDDKNETPFFDNVFHCPTNGCVTKSKYKHIVKHLKMCTDLKMKRNTIANNKVYPVCSKVFLQKSNRNRYVNIVHSQDLADDIAFDEFDNQHDEQKQNRTMPSMVTSVETVLSEVPQSLSTEVSTNHSEEEDAPFDQSKVKYRYREKTIETRKNTIQNKAAVKLLDECY